MIISPEWELRRNGTRAILLDRDPHKPGYLILDQPRTLILSLFNGNRSAIDVATMIAYLLDVPVIQADQLVNDTIKWVNKDGNLCLMPRNAVRDRDVVTYSTEALLGQSHSLEHPRRLEVPISLNITLTHRCQTCCRYCYAERRHIEVADELPLSLWLETIDQAADLGIDRVGLLGGDELARPDALDIFRRLVERGFWFFVSTKCHISHDTAARLADIGLGERRIQISIDAPIPEVADFLVGSVGFLDRVVDSLKNLLDCGLAVRAKAVLTPYNARLAPRLIQFLYDMGIREIQLIDYGRSHYFHGDDLFVDPADSAWVAEQVDKIRAEQPDVEIIYGAQARDAARSTRMQPSMEERCETWLRRSRCSGGASSMSIAPDGLVFLCEQIPQIPEHFVGDVRRQTIIEVWNSDHLLNYIYPEREHFIGSPCYDCDQFNDCHRGNGHCFRDALFAYGSRYLPPPLCPKALLGAPRLY